MQIDHILYRKLNRFGKGIFDHDSIILARKGGLIGRSLTRRRARLRTVSQCRSVIIG
jgi:hypothetical protein